MNVVIKYALDKIFKVDNTIFFDFLINSQNQGHVLFIF